MNKKFLLSLCAFLGLASSMQTDCTKYIKKNKDTQEQKDSDQAVVLHKNAATHTRLFAPNFSRIGRIRPNFLRQNSHGVSSNPNSQIVKVDKSNEAAADVVYIVTEQQKEKSHPTPIPSKRKAKKTASLVKKLQQVVQLQGQQLQVQGQQLQAVAHTVNKANIVITRKIKTLNDSIDEVKKDTDDIQGMIKLMDNRQSHQGTILHDAVQDVSAINTKLIGVEEDVKNVKREQEEYKRDQQLLISNNTKQITDLQKELQEFKQRTQRMVISVGCLATAWLCFKIYGAYSTEENQDDNNNDDAAPIDDESIVNGEDQDVVTDRKDTQ